MTTLYKNQLNAIQISIDNDFKSGIHYQATGTGKSLIAMNICIKYNQKYNNNNILWFCEQKNIIQEQFNQQKIKEYSLNTYFNIIIPTIYKNKNWIDSINASKYWGKPLLFIINRSLLTINENYKKIKIQFDLIIHDECHSAINKSTKKFYSYILTKNPNCKCIGFSATPNIQLYPFDNILSSYSIYDAYCDNIIVAPKIVWINKNEPLEQIDIIDTIKSEIIHLPYKKIIVWCGMIHYSLDTLHIWKKYFPQMSFYIDNSKNSIGYQSFYESKGNAFLFCANKHREGSDIPYLDGCVFIDNVLFRSSKVFIQCIGRVLRKDKEQKKQYGLIIDCNANKVSNICNRINKYLCLNNHLHIFPWNYQIRYIYELEIQSLIMKNEILKIKAEIEKDYTIEDLEPYLIRKYLLNKNNYYTRYLYEIQLLIEKKLIKYLIQAIHILKLTKDIPHVTRGSCGSSLVCFLLGISHVDPIEYNITFERFLTKYRNNLPDIDLDFPYNIRDDIFLKIELHEDYIGKVARISNHIYYKDKSAVRQAIRNVGIRKFIGKYDIDKEIKKCNISLQNKIKEETKKLKNTFRGYMLHCGGIVYYPNGIPKEHILPSKINNQIKLNKHDIAKEKHFKIDILSSRALAKYEEICKNIFGTYIELTDLKYDMKVYEMLCRGDNIGLTLGESPLIRKAFIKIQPRNIYDIAVCLAIIRPAVSNNRYEISNKINIKNDYMEDIKYKKELIFDDNIIEEKKINSFLQKELIFDDDAIEIISRECGISKDIADNYRRIFSKNDKDGIKEFEDAYNNKELSKKLKNLHKYSFCKSHAISYAQLIYGLAFMKCNYPEEFWKISMKHYESSSSLYKKWVYDININTNSNILNYTKSKNISIYAQNRRKNIDIHLNKFSLHQQLKLYGTWNMTLKSYKFFPKCYSYIDNNNVDNSNILYFNGIIATSRRVSNKHVFFIGTEINEFYEVIIDNKFIKTNIRHIIGIKGQYIINQYEILYKSIEYKYNDNYNYKLNNNNNSFKFY